MRTFCLCWAMALISLSGFSQQSPFEVSARTISAGNGNSFGNYELSLTYPVFRKEKTIVAAGIITDWYRNNLSGDSIGLRNLYRLSIPLMLQISLGEKYKLNIIADPSLSSDFEDISSKDFRYNAAIRLARNKNGHVVVGRDWNFETVFRDPSSTLLSGKHTHNLQAFVFGRLAHEAQAHY